MLPAKTLSRAGARTATLSSCHPSIPYLCPRSPRWVINRALTFVSPPKRSGCSEQGCLAGPACTHRCGAGARCPLSALAHRQWPCTCWAYGKCLCSCLKHQGQLAPSPQGSSSAPGSSGMASSAMGLQIAQQHQHTHPRWAHPAPPRHLFGIAKGHRGKQLGTRTVLRAKPSKQYFAFY